ncbi:MULTISPECIES: MBL fold metallo-hydrolase [Halolamina]|uniref:Glyoxylase, beta-lactamase superfamily II n=1 Tax=Halolamina pelagica TaxID=699431 RepID=A0A1I5T0J6_9EURY|nr:MULTISPECIES: MBL fold metallo-hydrolase [Halolamina]NHX36950.1 MBL fold metallo-hydrolase [Halolamina sp. R1-12]SFP76555.1 Glyoxylase, beta-lactamase superfamily II [Halolamina pelagica]
MVGEFPVERVPVPVETRAPTGTTNAYVVGDSPALLVDPAGRTGRLDSLVAEREIGAVAVTHTHPDHVGAVAEYAAETGAALLARRPERFADATGVDPDRQITEGSEIETGAGTVTVLDTPGHAVDHVAFELGGTVLCGDLAVAEGSVVVGAPEGDLRAYLTSLRRLRARDPDRLLPGHGPAMDGEPAPRASLDRLIGHRLDRERSVLDAVRNGASDLGSVVDAAYDKDLAGVRDLAKATVRAHVEKLAVEGRVDWNRESGRVRPE